MDINFWRDSKQPLTPHPPTPPFGVSPNIHPFLWVQGSLNRITSNANVSECNAFAIEQQATINQIPIITRKHIICKCCMKSKKSILSNLINIPFAQLSNETSISNGIDSLQRCYVMHRPWIWFSRLLNMRITVMVMGMLMMMMQCSEVHPCIWLINSCLALQSLAIDWFYSGWWRCIC